MATPSLSKHTLRGALGDILIDVRAGGRRTPRPTVLLVHGFKGFKDWGVWPALAERLARAGFSVVSFNMSGSGVDDAGQFSFPERFARNTYSAELHDLAAVVDALGNGRFGVAPPTSLGIVGHSRGGGMAVLYTARDPRVRALVTWSAIADVRRWNAEEQRRWREQGRIDVVNTRTGQVLPLYPDVLDDIERHSQSLDIVGAAAEIHVPWLIIHGTSDETVAVADAHALHAASMQESTQLLLVEGANHTFGATHPFVPGGKEIERAEDATLAWLAASLG